MSPQIKKLFLAFSALILVSLLLLTKQIKTTLSITTTAVDAPLVSPFAIDLPTNATDPLLGNPGAPLTLVVFADLADDSSRKLLSTVIAFVESHPAEARLIFKHSPQPHIFGDAILAHQQLWCAGAGAPFWTTLKRILNKQAIDDKSILTCATIPATVAAVANAGKISTDLGITSPPVLFVNNKQINLQSGVDIAQMLTTFIQK